MERKFFQLLLVLAICCIVLVLPVSADFTGTPTAGIAPLTVQFTDDSSNQHISSEWSFGDGSSENATDQNPVHTYVNAGSYTISLNVTDFDGVNSITNTTSKKNFITVHAYPPTVTGITPKDGSNRTVISITDLAGTNFTSGSTVMLTPVDVSLVTLGRASCGDGNSERVFVFGNYAYILHRPNYFNQQVLRIIDITDPSAQVLIDEINLEQGVSDIYVSDNYIYSVGGGLDIWGSGSLTDGAGGALLNNPSSVFVSGIYAYITSAGSNALEIVDVSDPANPVHKGSISDGSGGALLSSPSRVYVSGVYAYVTSAGSNALEIVDVSDPANPVHKGCISNGSGGALLSNPSSVYVSGIYAYVTSAGSNALEIVDVSDPANPVHKGSISDGSGGALLSSPSRVYVSGIYAYITTMGGTALEIVDVSDPTIPVHKNSNIPEGPDGSDIISVFISGNNAYMIFRQQSGDEYLTVFKLGNIPATNVSVVSPTQITCSVDLIGNAAGDYNVVVTNSDGQSSRLTNGFKIIHMNFVGGPDSGEVPLSVTFTDWETKTPSSWNWSFGDGHYSDLHNPVHIYESSGVFPVSLKTTYSDSSDVKTRINYITVRDPPPSVTNITPTTGGNTTSSVKINLTGYHFSNGVTVMAIPQIPFVVKKSTRHIDNPVSQVKDMYISDTKAYFVIDGSQDNLRIFDISDPDNPVYMGDMASGPDRRYIQNPKSVFVSGTNAYVANSGNNVLEIVDVSDPANPVHIGNISDGKSGAHLANPNSVFVSGTNAYVASTGSNALEIVDISDPANPVHKSSLSDGDGGAALVHPMKVLVAGHYAYVLCPENNTLVIIDISDPAYPEYRGSISDGDGGALLNNPSSVYVSGIYAYVTSVGSNALEIVDVSDPANPVHKGSISDGVGGALLSNPLRVYVFGNDAYITSIDSCVIEIVDVSDPSNPVHKGSITGETFTRHYFYPSYYIYVSGSNVYFLYNFEGGNFGIGDSGAILATNVSVDSNDYITCEVNLTGKAAGLYDLMVTNPDGQFGVLASAFTMKGNIDLVPTEINGPGQSSSVDGLSISWEVENRGNTQANREWTDVVYISQDQTLDASDIRLLSHQINNPLNPGEKYSVSEIITNSTPVPTGIYYLILNIDDQNEIFEEREKNNAISRPLQIGAEQTFNENAAHQSSLVEDLKSQNLTLDNGQVTGELTGTFNLTSIELATITSGSFNGQGFFKGFFMSNLDTIEYFGNVKGVIVPDPKNNKILLKGTISGSEINGMIDGSLTESQPGTGIYNKFNATFRLNQLGGKNVSATLSMQGDISYTSETLYPSTKFKYLQSSASGTLVGDYSEPISLVLNSIRVDDSQSQFDSKGFSVLTYSTSSITGEGWTNDHEYMPGFVSMDGFCSSNAFLVSGGGKVGQFAFSTNSVNKGAAPAPDLEIKPIGPASVSPGQRVTYGMEILNYGNAAGHEIESRITLSPDVYLVSASGDYYFDSRNHAVYWKDEIIPPRNTTIHTLTANVKSGLSQGTMIDNSILVKDASKENNTFYSGILWDKDKSGVKSLHTLLREYTASNLDADLKPSYYDTDVNNGSFHVWLASKNVETDKNYLVKHELGKAYRIAFSHSGGTQTLYKKLESGDIHADYAVFAAPAFLHQQKIADLINQGKIKKAIIAQSQRDVLYLTKSKTGWMWYIKYIPSPIGGVLALPWYGPASQVTDTICALPVVWEPLGSLIPIDLVPYLDNTKPFPTSHDIVPKVPEESYIGSAYRSAQVPFMSEDLDHDGELDIIAINNSFPEIPESFNIKKLEPGATLVHGALIGWVGELYQKGDYPFNGSIEGLFRIESIDNNKLLHFYSQVLTAHDPNIKYGPFGYVQAGQRLEYKVEFENEGKGIAYGVYITDRLDPALDDSTLAITPLYSTRDGTIIAPSGVYDATTRTITWLAGEVGPGAGGYSNVSINVRNDAIDKTEITNYATVFFPSVPEETRTNTIFSRVGMNHPPNIPEPLSPLNEATNVSRDRTVLSYSSDDPDGDVLSYDIYFGNQSPPLLVSNSWHETFYYPGILEYDTTYYWKVVAKDPESAITSSPVWSFRSSPPPHANFTVNSTHGVAPASVIFLDSSSGSPNSWFWEFGDGTNATEKDVIHTYTANGVYTVNLTIRDGDNTDTLSKTNLITVGVGVVPLPGFTNPPTDPDSDGLYEDLNANGFADWDDAVVLFWNTDWIQDNEPVSAFDFNGNGFIDWDDAVVLFWEV